ncbi:NADPH dehydrogenase NamA [Corynebacterium sputi]|uniref:NADPH dehydrogenase NamA n=1 Tax=Corynebacterium sputi TaxID=489915 RepID=UPI0004180285|nr:NADPH dehydrogenase NamA [Corynebacterium sputi]
MSALLFEPYSIRGVEFRNRIAMSPMCMHSANPQGEVQDFHLVHYGARALGGVGLIFPETLIVKPNGLIGPGDLGIWNDDHVAGLSRLTEIIHQHGAKIGAQIGHAGRMLGVDDYAPVAPSAVPWDENARIPEELDHASIREIVEAFGAAARRAKQAGFDVIEVHTAHGYLLNQFLSPLANHRTDDYGGDHAGRYRIVREVIDAVRAEWDGPLFVRVSTTDYAEGGNTPEDFVIFAKWMKEQGVDLVDASSGGVAPARVVSYPNYQVPAAELIRREAGIATGAVGLIESGRQAEEILRNNRADIVLVGREMLKDPFWPRTAADELHESITQPAQYTRYGSAWLRNQPKPEVAPMEQTVAQ